ncbi:hypothetical protein B0H14DRAFT_132404 [Mycena olivaceomarginata]|nr:hypothetical protein B0H14DRAFT_132404 [Mycena olivaceomarginata]
MLETSPELILEILDMLAVPLGFSTVHHPDRTALLSCSLVCKRWSAYAQRLLFRRVVINDLWSRIFLGTPIFTRPITRIISFSETITADTDKSRWLRGNVVSISLRPHPSARPNEILEILTKLPNLRELDILGVACMFSDGELSRLREWGPSIRSLRVNADHAGPLTSLGPQVWPAVIKLIAAIPAIRMLEITASTLPMPGVIPPLGLDLLLFKSCSKQAANLGPFLATLVGGRTRADDDGLQLFQTQSRTPADLHDILSAHSSHLRSLVVRGELKDPRVLDLCTHLERFECDTLPADELVAAIPRTINALGVAYPTPEPNKYLRSLRPSGMPTMSTASPYISVAHLTEELGTFPHLRVLTWMGSTAHPGFIELQERCSGLGVEMRSQATASFYLSDDYIEFSLRRRLLQF